MNLPVIPEKPQDWNIDVIDSLVQILSIESETFDFKGSRLNKKYDELYNDICAMANTSGGYIVLGIKEDKAPLSYFFKICKISHELITISVPGRRSSYIIYI